jgi:hypothetical protein
VIILMVEQIGGIACHTGRESCFYRVYDERRLEDRGSGAERIRKPFIKQDTEHE